MKVKLLRVFQGLCFLVIVGILVWFFWTELMEKRQATLQMVPATQTAPVAKQEASQVQAQPQPRPTPSFAVFPAPKPNEIVIQADEDFMVYELGSSSKPWKRGRARYAEWSGDKSRHYFFSIGKDVVDHAVIQFFGDDNHCWHKPKAQQLQASLLIFGLESFETSCGLWEYAPNIRVESCIFPSELQDITEVRIEAEPPLYLTVKTTLGTLRRADKKQGEGWIINRSWGRSFIAEAEIVFENPVNSILMDLPGSIPTMIPSLFGVVDRNVSVVTGLTGSTISTPNDASGRLVSVTNSLYPVLEWFEKLPESDQLDLVSRYAPTAAKIAVKLFSRELLDRFLLSLDWEADVVPADPRWYNGWYEIQPDKNKRVTHFMNLSFRDLEFRLFWARRGETFFRIVKRAVSDEVIATAANTKQ